MKLKLLFVTLFSYEVLLSPFYWKGRQKYVKSDSKLGQIVIVWWCVAHQIKLPPAMQASHMNTSLSTTWSTADPAP